ncbi:hypothetical protein FHS82_000518 [Pseudochelatococcus lubricantis]|uniref:DUF6460 domain-containing protein n=1 Tax=Pseudochelatococcus lubricantis TaxID=1538102 RepID=A0ABX0UXT0_9HYPH|nr:DUF6460 domain-containing protein [Pseudochelatococcus lubricantis]NIJ56705.1 hypothetical protein [Pseudochelatococcus lubricantis]
MSNGSLNRFLGGSPGGVLIRLLFLSLIVGAVMSWWGVSPVDLYEGITSLVRQLIDEGFASLRNVGIWIGYGAMIVVPVWLLLRILRSGSGQ